MNDEEFIKPEPVAKNTEKVRKNTLESGESDKREELDAEFVESIEKSKMETDDKVNFLLTKGGLKAASVIELPIKLQTQEEIKEFFKEDDIEEIITLVKKSGLEYHIGEKEIIEGTYKTKNEPEVEKLSKGEQLNIFISNSKENLDLLTKSWGTTDQEAIGKALGFPPTAVEAFVGKRKTWFDEDIPNGIREGEAVTFLTPTLSKDNWQEEIKEGKKRAEFIKRNSPEIYNTTMRGEINYRKWDKIKKELENAADSLGNEIDEGIKDSVIALNVFEINTSQSCEGHINTGMSAPWIRIEAPGEPDERFVGQNKAFEKAAKKYGITFEEAKRAHNNEAYWEAMKECSENGETKDYQKWGEESGKLLYVTKDILDDFYKNRQVSDNIKIKVDIESMEDMAEGSFEIFNGGEDYRDINDIKLSQKEEDALKKRSEEYRSEMKAFANFLKEKFFSEGESYMNDKRNKAQEKIDQEKIQKVMEKLKLTEAATYAQDNLKDFENVEIKKLSELPYWNKIDKFLNSKGITDNEVIIINDEEKWKTVYGSNDSKSSHSPKAILLKKEIFDRGDISEENISWLIHEIGHVEFYKNLGEKVDEYMEEYHKKGEYTDSDMEKSAFGVQFEYLKSIGKTKAECVDLIKKYLDKSFEENQEEEKKKEFKQLMKYIDKVY